MARGVDTVRLGRRRIFARRLVLGLLGSLAQLALEGFDSIS